MIEFIRRGGDAPQIDTPIGDYPLFLSRMLASRGLDTEEKISAFLSASKDDLSDPMLMPGMEKAKAILLQAKQEKTNTVIYGDYDCDGVTASAIMKETLDHLGIPCAVRLPDRHSEGYGLNEAAVREVAREAKLLITVDNGITAVNEIALAKELGMTVILTDHHRPHEVIPAADAIICPTTGGYPYDAFCGAGVAFCVARAMCGDKFAFTLLDLCALGTIADMVPLTGENRVLAKCGLEAIKNTKRPGLRELCKISAIGSTVTGMDVGFRLAPRINACGRLESADIALELLTTKDRDTAAGIAIRMQQLNEQRKDRENDLISSADAQLKAIDLVHRRAIVLWKEGWESGVAGLAAGRIAEKTGYPTVVLCVQDGKAVGSARSAGDVDIHKALEKCADLMIRFGGHKAAAGMTLEAENLEAFAERLSDAVREQTGDRPLCPRKEYDTEITLGEVTVNNILLLDRLEPFGMANPEPVFLIRGAEAETVSRCGRDGLHLRGSFRQDRNTRNGIGFNMGSQADDLPGRAVDLLISPTINEFRGERKPELRLNAIRTGGGSIPEKRDREDAALLRDLSILCDAPGPAAPARDAAELKDFAALPQGVCVVCRTKSGAEEAAKAFPDFEPCLYAADDLPAYNCILYAGSIPAVTAPFDRILLWEGEAAPGEALLWQKKTGAEVMTARQSSALRARLTALRYPAETDMGEGPGIPEMRNVYSTLARSGWSDPPPVLAYNAKQTESHVLTALFIMEHMELIRFTLNPFTAEPKPSAKKAMAADPLYRLIHQL